MNPPVAPTGTVPPVTPAAPAPVVAPVIAPATPGAPPLSDAQRADISTRVAEFKGKRTAAPGLPSAPPAQPNPVPPAAAPAAAPPAPAGAQPAAGAPPAAPAAPAEPKPEEPPAGSDPKVLDVYRKQSKVAFQQQQKERELKDLEAKIGPIARAIPHLKSTTPEKFFEEIGVPLPSILKTISENTKKIAAGGGAPGKPEDPSVKELRERTEKLEREQQERDLAAAKADRESKVTAYKGHIATEIAKKATDDYELIALHGEAGINAVFSLIDLTAKQSNGTVIPTIEEAARKVEAELVERSKVIVKAKKIAALVAPQPVPPVPPAKASASERVPPAQGNGQPSPTLTSQHTPNAAAAQPAAPRPGETREEKLRRLAPVVFPGQG